MAILPNIGASTDGAAMHAESVSVSAHNISVQTCTVAAEKSIPTQPGVRQILKYRQAQDRVDLWWKCDASSEGSVTFSTCRIDCCKEINTNPVILWT